MRRLTLSNDAGAVTLLVGVLLVPLLGAAALALDIGALYLERRELQNGADAAALAIAQDCAADPSSAGCTATNALPTAREYANSNSRDGFSSVADDGVIFDYAENKVTVLTSTNDPSSTDTSRLAHWFAPLLGFDATEVTATGVAIWGPVALSGDASIPITIGLCEWEEWTGEGSHFYYPPDVAGPLTVGQDYPFNPSIGWDRMGADGNRTPGHMPAKLQFQSGNPVQPAYCDPGEAGQNFPGGFGGLSTTSTCTVNAYAGTVDSSQGSLIETNDCKNYCTDANAICSKDPLMILGRVVNIPVFVDYNGHSKIYQLTQPAAFFVTSYDFGGGKWRGTLAGHTNCKLSGPEPECLEGYFTTAPPKLGAQVDVDGYDTGIRTTQLVLE